MSKLLRIYTRSFERNPSLTLMIANSTLMSMGDIGAQALAMSSGIDYDAARTLRFAVFGASMGPLAGVWNKFLEVNFPLRTVPPAPSNAPLDEKFDKFPIPELEKELPKGARFERGGPKVASTGSPVVQTEGAVSLKALLKRVAADQLGMAPISLLIFLFSMSLLEGLNGEETQEKIKNNYWPILFVNWQVWPILQLINFRYVPLRYRVPFGSILGILWTGFLSFKTADSGAHDSSVSA
ncbi:Mpv17/PMP22 family protein [Sporobolomyces salmoneus]|uniref:Mpv17/PMP22 family protein n=1 Tax=Sporobolomyces salmoneus TaxID=183962 RepID=UPI00317E9C0F